MNDPNSKKILFNKSTLFSLKAELLKKQEEVLGKKRLPQHKLENFKPLPAKDLEKVKESNKAYKKTFKDSLQAVDTEELEACRKAKLALEKKAVLYEHLSDSTGTSQLACQFLVDFSSKKQQEAASSKPIEVKETEAQPEQHDLHIDEDDNDWTEYTDCLGRTRKCLKSDLEVYKQRDKVLMRAMNITKDDEPENDDDESASNKSEKPILVQKTNDYLQSLREKWEQKEKELLAKDKDIHYQDLLFDEARMHGVGYFSFSTDEAERQKQMEELMKTREETLKAQKEAEEKRKKRDELIAARVAAARARQRARAGLPPEEPQENQKDFTTCLLEFLTEQKNAADSKAKEEEKRLKEEEEKERQKLREAYVREWDIGKEGTEEKLKKFRAMTQDEYVEQQRAKRIDEFAPPQAATSDRSDRTFDDKGTFINADSSSASVTKSWSEVRPKPKTPPPIINDYFEYTEQKGLYFSTSQKPKTNVKYKNFVIAQEPTPIQNELSDKEYSEKPQREEHNAGSINSAEIPPPPTFEYYGPVLKKSRQEKPFESNLREAYAQGTKSLESKATDRHLPKCYDFTFD